MPRAASFSLTPGAHDAPLSWRGLGQCGDLDLVFRGGNRAAAVTDVLCACANGDVTAAEVWNLTLSGRIGGLLAIWSASSGRDEMNLTLRCPGAGCGVDLEVALPLSDLQPMAQEAEDNRQMQHDDADGKVVRLCRPTGAHQAKWQTSGPQGDPEAVILADLLDGGTVPPSGARREALSERLSDLDPLPGFTLSLSCPDCGLDHQAAVDLEAEIMARLAGVQDRLFGQVDTLARRYGWTDIQIMALPPRRRARYLAFVEAEAGW